MNRSIASYLLSGFSNQYGYDVSYLEQLAEVSPGAFYRYLLCTPLSRYHQTMPLKPLFIAKAVATKHFDCGPCLGLVINMAREAQVDNKSLHAALTGNAEVLDADESLAMRYANAVVQLDDTALRELESQVKAQWGEAALVDLAIAVAFAAFYPMLRRGLGHGHSCEPVIRELAKLASQVDKGTVASDGVGRVV